MVFLDGGVAALNLAGPLVVATGDGNDHLLAAGLVAQGRVAIDMGTGNDRLRFIDSVFVGDWNVHTRSGDDELDLWHVTARRAARFDMGGGGDRVWIDVAGPARPPSEFQGTVDILARAGNDRIILGDYPEYGEDGLPLGDPLLFLDLLTVNGGTEYDLLEGRFVLAPRRRFLNLEEVYFWEPPDA